MFDFAPRYEEARARMRSWLDAGDITSLHDEVTGLEQALTGPQLAELRRARGEVSAAATPDPAGPKHHTVTTPTTDVPNHPTTPQ